MARIAGTPHVSFLVVAALLCSVPFVATPLGGEDQTGLAGCYDLTGVDTDELPYSGTLCVTVLRDLLYELTWTLWQEKHQGGEERKRRPLGSRRL